MSEIVSFILGSIITTIIISWAIGFSMDKQEDKNGHTH